MSALVCSKTGQGSILFSFSLSSGPFHQAYMQNTLLILLIRLFILLHRCNSQSIISFPSLSLGIYAFGLFATDIFVNAGQVVTGNLAPHFLALCNPNYTALGCQQFTEFISGAEACSGNPDLIMRARKTFPSKEAALSIYAATYITVSKIRQLCLGCWPSPQVTPTCRCPHSLCPLTTAAM